MRSTLVSVHVFALMCLAAAVAAWYLGDGPELGRLVPTLWIVSLVTAIMSVCFSAIYRLEQRHDIVERARLRDSGRIAR